MQWGLIHFGPYFVHLKHRDSLYVVHLKCRDCPYIILNIGTVPTYSSSRLNIKLWVENSFEMQKTPKPNGLLNKEYELQFVFWQTVNRLSLTKQTRGLVYTRFFFLNKRLRIFI